MEDKRGELSSKYIIAIIILIVSFGVIIFFWIQFSGESETDLEVCRNSVVARGAIPVLKESVKLQCKTRKICLTENSCDTPEKYDEIIRVHSKDELELKLAELMYDCWWMMGAGKIDYRGGGVWENLYCAQCAIVNFDDSVQNKYEKITYLELLNEMRKNSIPGSDMSYMKYIYGTDSLEEFLAKTKISNENIDLSTSAIDLRYENGYVIVTGILKAGTFAAIGAIGGVVIGGAFTLVSGPPGWVAAAIIVGSGAAGGSAGYLISFGDDIFMSPMLIPYNASELGKLECKEFDTLL